MTDHEIENKWNEMIDAQAPELWQRIESRMEEEKRPGFISKLKQFAFGGGTLRSAAVLTCLCVILIGAAGGLSRGIGMGGTSPSYATGTWEADAKSNGAEAAAGAYEVGEMAEEAAMDGDVPSEASGASAGADVQVQEGRKLIRDVNISAETMEFDALIEKVKSQVSQAGGYLEQSEISGSSYGTSSYNRRYASLTIRIPSGQTDGFLTMLEGSANIISRSEGMKDVTLQYVDMESHIKALRTEEEQLLKLMENADSTETLIMIQSELTEVRYQIESYQSQLNTFDNLIEYDTVYLYIDEVKQETLTGEPTAWERIRDGFARNLEGAITGIGDLVIWMITMIPYFILLFVVIAVIIAVIRRLLRRRTTKNSKKN
jgi:hypothetical protein